MNPIVTIRFRAYPMITCHSSLSCSATVLSHEKIGLEMIQRPISHQGTELSTLLFSFGYMTVRSSQSINAQILVKIR